MSLKQLTVFVQNKQGTVVSIAKALAENNINLRALSIAETEDFGILRLIVSDVEAASKKLADEGYLLKAVDVVGIKISDEPGKLAEALDALDKAKINVNYLYSFMVRTEKHAYIVLSVENIGDAENALTNAGFKLIAKSDIEKL